MRERPPTKAWVANFAWHWLSLSTLFGSVPCFRRVGTDTGRGIGRPWRVRTCAKVRTPGGAHVHPREHNSQGYKAEPPESASSCNNGSLEESASSCNNSSLEEHTLEERTLEEHTLEEHTLEEHTLEERTLEEHTLEEHTLEENIYTGRAHTGGVHRHWKRMEEYTVKECTLKEYTLEEHESCLIPAGCANVPAHVWTWLCTLACTPGAAKLL